ncbi:MAG: hypothetical protein ABIG61_17620 [Planctomycetota bacterium]
MNTQIPEWVLQLKTNVIEYVNGLMVPGAPFGRFRFAKDGCVYLPYDIISVHTVADIYQKLRMTESLTPQQKQEWIDLSLSWRDPETGEVRDPEGIEKGVPDNDDLACSVTALKRNMNRCCAGVFGSRDNQPTLQQEVKAFLDIDKMHQAFDAEPWETYSWGAGAHCAHYLLAMLNWRDAGYEEFDRPIKAAVEYLYAKQNPETGAFGGKKQDAVNIIGGILKIYARLFATMDLEIRYPERVIDTAIDLLRSGQLQGNCPAHNALIVLLMCKSSTNYREDDVRNEAYISLERDIRPRLKKNSSFCSIPDTSSEYYYWGVKMVEHGYDQGEIHSTQLALQAIRVVFELLDMEEELGYEPSGWYKKRTCRPFEKIV